MPTREQLTMAWGDDLLARLRPRPKAMFKVGRFSAVEGDVAVFALPNEHTVRQGEQYRADIEAALSEHFSTPVRVRLVTDDAPPVEATLAVRGADDEEVDVSELEPAAVAQASPAERIIQAFPGAEEIDQ